MGVREVHMKLICVALSCICCLCFALSHLSYRFLNMLKKIPLTSADDVHCRGSRSDIFLIFWEYALCMPQLGATLQLIGDPQLMGVLSKF